MDSIKQSAGIMQLKRTMAVFLIFILFLQTFSKIWIGVSFKLNQAQIAQTLCEKKDFKNNTCKGRCQLKKQLKQAEEREQKEAPQPKKESIETLYYCQLALFIFPKNQQNWQKTAAHIFLTAKVSTAYAEDFYPAAYIHDIFRPPQA